jgi:creatinine amidohydrolase
LNVYLLEELSTPALDRLDRDRTVIILTVSPLEEHGPHLPVGVDAFTARHFATSLAQRLVAARPGWSAVLAPTLHLGSFTFEAPGTVTVRQRLVRDVLIDYGASLARSRFRYIFIANGHGGPGHLAALDEAAAAVCRRHGVTMASLSSHLVWRFLTGAYADKIEAVLGRPLSDVERQALRDDAHGGWWETSMMLMLRPELVDQGYRQLPARTYAWPARIVRNYPLRDGGPGYVGHPALADPAFAAATSAMLMDEAMALVDGLLDGTVARLHRRSPFFALPFFRTNFWRATLAVGVVATAAAAGYLSLRTARPASRGLSSASGSR